MGLDNIFQGWKLWLHHAAPTQPSSSKRNHDSTFTSWCSLSIKFSTHSLMSNNDTYIDTYVVSWKGWIWTNLTSTLSLCSLVSFRYPSFLCWFRLKAAALSRAFRYFKPSRKAQRSAKAFVSTKCYVKKGGFCGFNNSSPKNCRMWESVCIYCIYIYSSINGWLI